MQAPTQVIWFILLKIATRSRRARAFRLGWEAHSTPSLHPVNLYLKAFRSPAAYSGEGADFSADAADCQQAATPAET
jgi:hypothetical protein